MFALLFVVLNVFAANDDVVLDVVQDRGDRIEVTYKWKNCMQSTIAEGRCGEDGLEFPMKNISLGDCKSDVGGTNVNIIYYDQLQNFECAKKGIVVKDAGGREKTIKPSEEAIDKARRAKESAKESKTSLQPYVPQKTLSK